jgi:hypothetical protein
MFDANIKRKPLADASLHPHLDFRHLTDSPVLAMEIVAASKARLINFFIIKSCGICAFAPVVLLKICGVQFSYSFAWGNCNEIGFGATRNEIKKEIHYLGKKPLSIHF